MANPFKEAEKAKKKAPGSKQEPEVKKVPTQEEKPVEIKETPSVAVEEKIEEKPVEKVVEKEKAETKSKPKKEDKGVKDIFASLAAEKPSGKTYSFYLTDENAAKLKKMADKKGISASKLLDHILSEVL
jgi:hypothetical protein